MSLDGWQLGDDEPQVLGSLLPLDTELPKAITGFVVSFRCHPDKVRFIEEYFSGGNHGVFKTQSDQFRHIVDFFIRYGPSNESEQQALRRGRSRIAILDMQRLTEELTEFYDLAYDTYYEASRNGDQIVMDRIRQEAMSFIENYPNMMLTRKIMDIFKR